MEKFSITPNSIHHNENPVFQAHWISGEIQPLKDNPTNFYYAGSGENDSLLLTHMEWQDKKPEPADYDQLMDTAISAIDHWISQRF